jgi:hypothetical protein
MKFLNIFILFCLIFSLFSCNNKLDKEITNLLDTRKQAFEEKNTGLYQELIFSGYEVKTRSGSKKKEDVLKDFKLNTTPFDKIEMSHKDRTVYNEGNNAKVVQKTAVLLTIEDQKTTYEITEVILLQKENNEWRISKESRLDLFRGFVFGKQS